MNLVGCSELCQHPGCWKSELEHLKHQKTNRNHPTTTTTKFIKNEQLNQQQYIYDDRKEQILDTDGSLPTYKILNVLEEGFGSQEEVVVVNENGLYEDEESNKNNKNNNNNNNNNEEYDPQWSSFHIYQDKRSEKSRFHPSSTRNSTAAYMKKLWQRYEEIRAKEDNKFNANKKHVPISDLKCKTLEFDDGNEEFEKILIWVPGKKSKTKDDKSPPVDKKLLSIMLLDGNAVPEQKVTKNISKPPAIMASALSQRTPLKLPPLFTEDEVEQYELYRFLGLSLRDYMMLDSRQSDNTVRVPSPLLTKRMSLLKNKYTIQPKVSLAPSNTEESMLPSELLVKSQEGLPGEVQATNKTADGEDKSNEEKTSENDGVGNSLAGKKLLFIRNGEVLATPKSSAKRTDRQKPDALTQQLHNTKTKKKKRKSLPLTVFKRSITPRSPLTLTRVSVPKKKIRQYPIFNHCPSSIKEHDFPDVSMEPLTSSERSSKVSSMTSLPKVRALSCHSMGIQCSDREMGGGNEEHVVAIDDVLDDVKIVRFAESENSVLSRKHTPAVSPELVILNKTSSCPMLTTSDKPTKTSDNNKDVIEAGIFSDKKVQDVTIENKIVDDNQISLKKSQSLVNITVAEHKEQSRPGSCGFSIDNEIMMRTYDKYRCLTPYKTPAGSQQFLPLDGNSKDGESLDKKRPQQQNLRPTHLLTTPSKRNIDSGLPPVNVDLLKTNASFLGRNMSPSKMLFLKQHKQPRRNDVPKGLNVSQLQLNIGKPPSSPVSPFLPASTRRKSHGVKTRLIPFIPHLPNSKEEVDTCVLEELEENEVIKGELVEDNDYEIIENQSSAMNEAESYHSITVASNENSRIDLQHLDSVDELHGNEDERLETIIDSVEEVDENLILDKEVEDFIRSSSLEENGAVKVESETNLSTTAENESEIIQNEANENEEVCSGVEEKPSEEEEDEDEEEEEEGENNTLKVDDKFDESSLRSPSVQSNIFHSPVMQDFSDVLEADLDLDDEVLRAMNGIDDFLIDSEDEY